MKLAIGIDTGGTCTDAVLYDAEAGQVLAAAKALTTREDLTIGIGKALDQLPAGRFSEVRFVGLSTTLATNACVEGIGGRAKLLFIGVDPRVVDWVGSGYGFLDKSELYFCENRGTFDGTVVNEPDWEQLLRDTGPWLRDADGLGIVELNAMNNGAVCEKKAREVFRSRYSFPIVCGHELFSGLNSLQRGASTLLNVKLVPLIERFLEAVRASLEARGIAAPVLIVRSDGSLMSEEFSRRHPVETILCGPAASVLGGVRLAQAPDSIIVDIGGTTTDISLIRAGEPVRVTDGVRIGPWKTFVDGVFIDTFGLGGDSRIRVADGRLTLDTRRVIPLSLAAARWPGVLEKLRALGASERAHTYPLHEFLCLQQEPAHPELCSERERELCRLLREGPLMLEEAALAVDSDVYSLKTDRLEQEGVLIRCGMTPTDLMHLRGDYRAYVTEAAQWAAKFLCRCVERDQQRSCSVEQLCADGYDLVERKLYCNLVRILLQSRYPHLQKDGLDPQLTRLIDSAWELRDAKDAAREFGLRFSTESVLVGIGAPTHVFLPEVARALGCRCVIPEYAGVANAVGAISGSVTAISQVEIRPFYSGGLQDGYVVCGKTENRRVQELEEAIVLARREAEEDARAEAVRRGAHGEIAVRSQAEQHSGMAAKSAVIDLGACVTATAVGRIL